MNQIDVYRNAGNKAYGEGDYKTAISAYSQALQLFFQVIKESADPLTIDQTSSLSNPLSALGSAISSAFTSLTPTASNINYAATGDEDPLIVKEKAKAHVLFSNRSAAFLHMGKPEESLMDAKKCIEIQLDWPKGYFRKGEALIALQRYDEALPALYRALERYSDSDKASVDLINKRIKLAAYSLQDKNRNIRIMQLLAVRDFAVSSWSPLSTLIFGYAKMMQNHIYGICCEITKECVLVDVCWDVEGVLDYVTKQGYTVTAAIVTHYHFDHVGGLPPPPYDQYRVRVDGLEKLLKKVPGIKAYVHSADVAEILQSNDIPIDRLEPTHDNYKMNVGKSVNLRFIHTPGHTPGSQCILVNDDRLLSGDTLFIGNVGRLDFPDSDAEKMFVSMDKLRNLKGDIMVYPGHDYGGSFTTLEREKNENPVLSADNFNSFFMAAHGG